jgi:hypothetical protein
MFVAEGLVMKRSGEAFVPYYFSYEDLVEDWQKLPEDVGKSLKV